MSSSSRISSIRLFRRKNTTSTTTAISQSESADMTSSPSALHQRPSSSSSTTEEELPLHRRHNDRKKYGMSTSFQFLLSNRITKRRRTLSILAVVVISTVLLMTLLGGQRPSSNYNNNSGGGSSISSKDYWNKNKNGRKLGSFHFFSSWGGSSNNNNPKGATVVKTQEPIPNDWVVWDVIIVGAGPAGLTAALFTARAGLSTLVLGSSATGQLSQTKHLDNFPSFSLENGGGGGGGGGGSGGGPGWLETTKRQTLDFGTEFVPPGILVKSIVGQDQTHHGLFVVETDESIPSKFTTTTTTTTSSGLRQDPVSHSTKTTSTLLRSWSVIVASGATPKQLNLQPHEKELWGKSLHSCAICDGHLYTNKKVVVVGGGDAAVDAALMLSRFASKVFVVHRRTEFSSVKNHVNLELMKSTSNIEIKTPYVVESWEVVHDTPLSSSSAAMKLTGAKVKRTDTDDGATELLQVDGGFIMIGAKPNTDWLASQQQRQPEENDEKSLVGIEITPAEVDVDTEGLIRVVSPDTATTSTSTSTTTTTTVEGIFAAGEVVDKVYKQAITASAQGAQAAIDAERWLREKQHKQQLVDNLNDNAIQLMTNQIKKQQQQSENRHETQKHVEEKKILEQDQKGNVKTSTGTASSNDNCDLKDEQCIRRLVSTYPVVVFSKSWCPYCRKAMEALSLAGIKEPHVVDLTQRQDAVEIQGTLQQMTGRRTVPNVFVGGKSIGGGDETSALQRQGKLVPLLQDAGAFPTSAMKKDDTPVQRQHQQPASASQRAMKGDGVNCDLLSDECFDETIKNHPVIMFSLSWCPECKRSLELFDRIGVPRPFVVDLDDHRPIALKIRDHMSKRTGRNQVPNLWIGGDWVGGYALMQEKHSRGELLPMFEKVGIVPRQQQ